MRRRPNYGENRYNQWVLAGKIALQTNAMPEVTEAVTSKRRHGVNYNIYCTETGQPDYSIVGQEYLRRLEIAVTELD